LSRLVAILLVGLALGAVLLVLGEQGIGPVVITREDEQKVVLLLGNPRDAHTAPGLSLRWPLLEEVRTFDRRWLHLSSEPKEIQTLDRERILVDNYVIWRIADPLLFLKSFPTGLVEAEAQIDREVRASVREVIGRTTLADVLGDMRVEIMQEMVSRSDRSLRRFGIEINDIRINRTELPRGAEENVFARMRAERERQARKHRAEGDEEARNIRAEADREARVIVAEARRQAEIERGSGDAEAARIYAEAYSRDSEFYGFVRSLEAYRKTIGEGTTMVLSPDHAFFRILQAGGVEAAGAEPAALP
jgi:modulator of FtsH protease HflC